jgi:hypothetical protein
MMGFFLFVTASIPALGLIKPPIKWVTGALSQGVKLTTHLHLVPKSKDKWSYTLTPPIRFNDALLG